MVPNISRYNIHDVLTIGLYIELEWLEIHCHCLIILFYKKLKINNKRTEHFEGSLYGTLVTNVTPHRSYKQMES